METFVVRVFIASDHGDIPLCGLVQHVGTNHSEPFSGAQDLISIVLGALRPQPASADEGEQPPN